MVETKARADHSNFHLLCSLSPQTFILEPQGWAKSALSLVIFQFAKVLMSVIHNWSSLLTSESMHMQRFSGRSRPALGWHSCDGFQNVWFLLAYISHELDMISAYDCGKFGPESEIGDIAIPPAGRKLDSTACQPQRNCIKYVTHASRCFIGFATYLPPRSMSHVLV